MQIQRADKAKTGRPSKLTESRMEMLIEALQAGAYRKDACRAAGIHYNTLLAWEKKGESESSGEFVEFLDALRMAEAEAVIQTSMSSLGQPRTAIGERPRGSLSTSIRIAGPE